MATSRDTGRPMAQTDIEALRAEYEAIGRRDWEAVFRDVHETSELRPDRGALAGPFRGREQARQAFEDFLEPFEEVLAEPQEFFERGAQIVVFFLLRSRPRGSDAVVEIRAAHLWTLRDGKAVRCEIFQEREKALESRGAVGVGGVAGERRSVPSRR
jgi:ketosteroid isomerase-like protein